MWHLVTDILKLIIHLLYIMLYITLSYSRNNLRRRYKAVAIFEIILRQQRYYASGWHVLVFFFKFTTAFQGSLKIHRILMRLLIDLFKVFQSIVLKIFSSLEYTIPRIQRVYLPFVLNLSECNWFFSLFTKMTVI